MQLVWEKYKMNPNNALYFIVYKEENGYLHIFVSIFQENEVLKLYIKLFTFIVSHIYLWFKTVLSNFLLYINTGPQDILWNSNDIIILFYFLCVYMYQYTNCLACGAHKCILGIHKHNVWDNGSKNNVKPFLHIHRWS